MTETKPRDRFIAPFLATVSFRQHPLQNPTAKEHRAVAQGDLRMCPRPDAARIVRGYSVPCDFILKRVPSQCRDKPMRWPAAGTSQHRRISGIQGSLLTGKSLFLFGAICMRWEHLLRPILGPFSGMVEGRIAIKKANQRFAHINRFIAEVNESLSEYIPPGLISSAVSDSLVPRR